MAVCLNITHWSNPAIKINIMLCDSNASAVVAGRARLTDHLQLRKVLIVIDDTDDAIQLKNLLPTCELHPASLVIVTSRKRDVLDARCTNVKEVQLLPKGHDVQLFNAWAFAAGPPAWDASVLIPDVVACCGRLPLTLKVGAFMLISVASTQ